MKCIRKLKQLIGIDLWSRLTIDHSVWNNFTCPFLGYTYTIVFYLSFDLSLDGESESVETYINFLISENLIV